MKTPFLGLRTAIYKVPDLQEARRWYSEVLNVKPYFDEPFYTGYNVGGFELGLMPDESKITDKPDSVLTYWGVENVESAFKRLIEMGATPHGAPENVGGDIMVATVKDPWGNVFGIIYNPEFKLK